VKYIIFVIATIFLSLNETIAQIESANVQFEQITNESGRTLGFISGIEQDSTGFLWISSRNGLYRYDGYNFSFFRHSKRSEYALPFTDITFSYYDRSESFWLRHFDKLYLFSKNKIDYKYDTITNKKFSHNTQVVQDIDHNYWIGPHDKVLYRFNPQSFNIDTFTCQTNLIHPEILKEILNYTNNQYQIKPHFQQFLLDTTITINITKDQYFIVATGGEGNKYSFFDYATIKRDNQVIWTPTYEKCDVESGKSLYYCQTDLIFLAQGNYSLHFKTDDANTFNESELNDTKSLFYGIALVPVKDVAKTKQQFHQFYVPKNGIFGNAIYQIIIGNNGYPIITTDKGVQEYHPQTQRYQIVETIEVPQKMRNSTYIPICQTRSGRLVYAQDNQIYVQENDAVHNFELPINGIVLCLMVDYKDYIWVGTTKGLFVFDSKEKLTATNLTHITASTTNRLFSNNVWQIFEDKSYNIWIGTDKGLNQYRRSKFEHVNISEERFSVQPIVVDENGNAFLLTQDGLWTTIKGNTIHQTPIQKSLFLFDPLTNEYQYDMNDMKLLDNKIIFTVSNVVGLMDKSSTVTKTVQVPDLEIGDKDIATQILILNNHIWVSTIAGITVLNKNLELVKTISHPRSIESSYEINKSFVKDIQLYNQDYIAIRTEKDIYTISVSDYSVKNLFEIPDMYHGTTSASGNIAVEGDSVLWFAVLPKIVRVTNCDSIDQFTLDIHEDIGNSRILMSQKSMTIYSNNGLIKIENYKDVFSKRTANITDDQYENYTTREGLADNFITSMVLDKNENIWLTTLKGLSFLDYKTGEIQNFFREGDFLSLGFPGSQMDRKDNNKEQRILQTTKGLLYFKPDSVNPIIPNVVINEVLLFGKKMDTDSLIWEKNHLELKHNQNFLNIGFSSLDYTQPILNKYRYRLLNFNNEWTYTDANNRKAPFTGLPPGEYVFIVQGTNSDGVWNNIGQRLVIKITPPWYRTMVAYILYVIIAIVSVVLFVKIRERNLVAEKRILEAKVKARTREILKQKEEILEQSDKIANQNKNITDSIHYASRIQAALLPSTDILSGVLPSYFVLWRPRDIVSGDFYWFTHEDDLTIVVAADCTGHGVPGAFMSMLGIAFLNDIVNKEKIKESSLVLNELRSYIMKALKQTGEDGGSKDGMDIALCAIDQKKMKVQFSGAYNPLIIIRNGEIIEIKADKMPIGYHIKKDVLFTGQDIDIEIGDRLYMFSDGYVDQFGGETGRKFMSKRFKELLVETNSMSMEEQKEHLNDTIEQWMGDYEQIDDILVFGIEIVKH